MKELYEMYASLGVSREVYEFGQSVLDSLKARFEGIDAVAEYNQAKVIRAMQEHRVDATCFAATMTRGATTSSASMPTASIRRRRSCARRSPAARTRWPSR